MDGFYLRQHRLPDWRCLEQWLAFELKSAQNQKW